MYPNYRYRLIVLGLIAVGLALAAGVLLGRCTDAIRLANMS